MKDRAESFLKFLADERHLSINTLSAYRNDLRQFEEYLLSDRAREVAASPEPLAASTELHDTSRAEVVDFFLQLREKGYSPATIARKMAAVKSMFQYLHHRGIIAVNPAALLGAPEVKKPLPRAISVADTAALLSQARKRSSPEGLRDAAMLQVLCATGMRVTELVSLDLNHLDLTAAQILCTGRNGRRRELPIDESVLAALDLYLGQGRPHLQRDDDGKDALFLNHRGRRLTRQGFWLIMKALARESGISTEVTPHTLRHSFAAHRLKNGLELQRLRELLGHANISTTQIYTLVHLEPDSDSDGAASATEPVGARS